MSDAWDGRPERPEEDGPHWVRFAGYEPDIAKWSSWGNWRLDDVQWSPEAIAERAVYLGPCVPPVLVSEPAPADLRDLTTGEAAAWRAGWDAARGAAAMRAGMEGVAASCQMEDAPPDSPSMVYQQGRTDGAARIVAAIRAMEPPR